MVAQAQPNELASAIGEKLESIGLRGGRRLDPTGFEAARLLREINRLQKDDAITASLLKAQYFALAGMREDALHWADNAGALARDQYACARSRLEALMILGYPHEAVQLFDDALKIKGAAPIHQVLRSACAFGWFDRAVKLLSDCRDEGLVHTGVECMHLAPRAAEVFKQRGLDEEMINDSMAELHGVLREENLLWQGFLPEISIVEEGTGDAYVSMRFGLNADAMFAAELSWKLIERLVEKNFDRPGLALSFMPTVEVVSAQEKELSPA